MLAGSRVIDVTPCAAGASPTPEELEVEISRRSALELKAAGV
jgi:hypothetical protein